MTATPETAAKPRRRNRRIAGADPDKRRQILDGALAVFMARGFDAATMSDIAAAANVSKGTLYVYFEDKEHLFVALIERERESQKRAAFEALDDDPDIAPRPDQLRREAHLPPCQRIRHERSSHRHRRRRAHARARARVL